MEEQGRQLISLAWDNIDPSERILQVGEVFCVPVVHEGRFLSKPLVGEFDLVVEKDSEQIVVDWKTSANSAFGCGWEAVPVRLFEPGQLVTTPGVTGLMQEHDAEISRSLKRHLQGDWGDLCEEDQQANQEALQEGLRLLSAYRLSDGTRIWIITEANRSATTILLPEEY